MRVGLPPGLKATDLGLHNVKASERKGALIPAATQTTLQSSMGVGLMQTQPDGHLRKNDPLQVVSSLSF